MRMQLCMPGQVESLQLVKRGGLHKQQPVEVPILQQVRGRRAS